MLVYLKQDLSYTSIDGQRVYGEKFAYGSFGPTNISIKVYKANRDILKPAKYTKAWLEQRFKKCFPKLSFSLVDLNGFDLKTLINISEGLGISYIKSRHPTQQEKRALVRSIKKIISQA